LQATHHLGGQLIKQAHPIIGRHLLDQLQHLTAAQTLEQGLLNSGIEMYSYTVDRLILGQQAKRESLQGARQGCTIAAAASTSCTGCSSNLAPS
jgi:hypothetical protein